MTITEAVQRMKAAGFGGVAVWEVWGQYNACPLHPTEGTPLHDMNLWEHVDSPEEAVALAVEKAEERPAQGRED